MSRPFDIGRRWLCEDPTGFKRDYPFHFVIIGPANYGAPSRNKMCRLEVVGHTGQCCLTCHHGLTQSYSHKHLKKHAKLLPEGK